MTAIKIYISRSDLLSTDVVKNDTLDDAIKDKIWDAVKEYVSYGPEWAEIVIRVGNGSGKD